MLDEEFWKVDYWIEGTLSFLLGGLQDICSSFETLLEDVAHQLLSVLLIDRTIYLNVSGAFDINTLAQGCTLSFYHEKIKY